MKSLLKTLSFGLAVGFPSALLAQFAGASLPSAAGPSYLFFAFVVSLLLLTVLSDYTRQARQPARLATQRQPLGSVTTIRSLAASERLAA